MTEKQTIPSVRNKLRELWDEGQPPVELIRFLRERGYLGAEIGVALSDTFGIKMIHQRFAESWREDGSGAADTFVNEELAKGIREADMAHASPESGGAVSAADESEG